MHGRWTKNLSWAFGGVGTLLLLTQGPFSLLFLGSAVFLALSERLSPRRSGRFLRGGLVAAAALTSLWLASTLVWALMWENTYGAGREALTYALALLLTAGQFGVVFGLFLGGLVSLRLDGRGRD